ncbi:1-deoxy-D-xylulose 5-phosphate reductoisomerase [Pseudoalteromonas luteoviolacea B = ATCC 29581]|nr:1-deoxy-D-xylulose 5-phosphate reductoisomerase [Pseudoalteromonas luteoviolacea B = ATCC 29581]
MTQQVVVLGSTGSIGQSTLDVIARNRALYQVFALVAGTNVEKLVEQCIVHQPQFVVLSEASYANTFKSLLKQSPINPVPTVLSGVQAMREIAAHDDVDIVMAAIVGAAGLLPTLSAVEAGKKVLLANKEALVMTGRLFMDKVRKYNATLLPIDSEHNAIYQCLPVNLQKKHDALLSDHGVSKILLTGSGGPFLNRDIDTLASVTVSEAVSHPNWSMGQKISVDSATMMNKGLEFIEAKWLFNCEVDDIEVVIHPQSMIHSMVQYRDGSVIAQLGQPDMRTPIAYGLAYPERIDAGVAPLDFSKLANFSFMKPDFTRYPNLRLAMEACKVGQAATTTVNAANEVAVSAFLQGKIGFCDIYRVNEQTLTKQSGSDARSLDAILEIDRQARRLANDIINELR